MYRVPHEAATRRCVPIAFLLAATILCSAFLAGSPPSLSAELVGSTSAKASPEKKRKKKKDKKDSDRDSDSDAGDDAPDVDELFVRDHLEEVLRPTSIKFLKDGRVTMKFKFGDKDPAHEGIFTPKIRSSDRGKIRWTLPGEEYWYYDGGDTKEFHGRGIRVSDKGMFVLNCWFKNDVEAEVIYGSGTNSTGGALAAVTFTNSKKASLASNFGSQCVMCKGGRPGKRSGKARAMDIYSVVRMKLVVNEEEFEAHVQGRKQASMRYPTKSFQSGRIGFLWAGRQAGTLSRLSITGRIDTEKMAERIKKAKKKRKR